MPTTSLAKEEKPMGSQVRHPLALEPMPAYAKDLDLTPLSEVVNLTGRPFVAFDIESTTFVHAQGFGITEIGIVCVNLDHQISVASTLLGCELHIHHEVSEKTGIDRKSLIGKPKFPVLSERLRGLFGRATVAGYYSDQFDVPGIRKECQRYGIEPIDFPYAVDVAKLTKHLPGRSKSNKLVSVAESVGITLEGNAHRALYDTLLTAAIAARLVQTLGPTVLA